MFIKTIKLLISGKLPQIIVAVKELVEYLHMRKASKKDGFNQKEKIELFDACEEMLESVYRIFK